VMQQPQWSHDFHSMMANLALLACFVFSEVIQLLQKFLIPSL
jgi:hypothetical protein